MNKPEKNCLNCVYSKLNYITNRWICFLSMDTISPVDVCENIAPRFPIPIEPHIDETIINPGLE